MCVGGYRLIMGSPLIALQFIYWGRVSHWARISLIWGVYLTSLPWVSPVFCLPRTMLSGGMPCLPGFYICVGHPNSRCHTYTSTIIVLESSLSPWMILWSRFRGKECYWLHELVSRLSLAISPALKPLSCSFSLCLISADFMLFDDLFSFNIYIF